MNIPDLFGQFRPIFSLIGSIAICAGLLDFASVLNVPGSGLETAIAGFLVKHI